MNPPPDLVGKLRAITESPAYRLAFADLDLLGEDEKFPDLNCDGRAHAGLRAGWIFPVEFGSDPIRPGADTGLAHARV